MKQARGFTLVELMISLAIFALLVTMAYQSVNLLMDSNRRMQQPQAAFQQLQRAMILLERDFYQLSPRKQSNAFGNQIPALVLPENNGLGELLEFTRGGNPDVAWELRKEGQMRSTLQRVRYRLKDKVLQRETWNLVDHVETAEPVSIPVLNGVKQVKFSFQATQGESLKEELPEADKLPIAIQITLEHEQFGIIRRIFLLYR